MSIKLNMYSVLKVKANVFDINTLVIINDFIKMYYICYAFYFYFLKCPYLVAIVSLSWPIAISLENWFHNIVSHHGPAKRSDIWFYVPVAYILYLRNPPVYSNSPSILCCFTDSVRFLDFFLRDVIFSGMLYFHNIPLTFIISRSI
jgi:hypothetical protein